MRTRIAPGASPPRSAPRSAPFSAPRTLLLLVAAVALGACHPGNEEAKRLTRSCEAGQAVACNQLAVKLQKGEYVLRD
ncbi:MAG: hypothetical protein V4617_11875, partial [Gemmatimonadota bacterium]